MTDANDMDLVHEYSDRNSEPAFAELVRRHINLVHSVALRFTGDPQDAQDVTQAVFLILAQKANCLRAKTILTGWLYQTTRFTAKRFLRTKIRRQLREQKAYMSSQNDSNSENVWRQLAPLLEEAMTRLSENDRTLVALRYFENKSAAETAALLGVQEWAAHKRAARALEKLRKFFTSHGVNSTATAIAEAISANSIQAAPAALATATTAFALAKGAAVSTSSFTLTKGALKFMAWTNAKTAIVAGAVLLVAGATSGILVLKSKTSTGFSHDPPAANNGNDIVDRTTPVGDLIVMAKAMDAGDAKAYVESCVFSTPDELRLKASMEEFVGAVARFRQAVSDKFGVEQLRENLRSIPLVFPPEALKNAEVKIEGDSATVDPFKGLAKGGKGGRPVEFVKVGGEWKMKGFGFIHVSPDAMSHIFAHITEALDGTAVEVSQNKYKTAAEAVKTMKERTD